MAHEDVSYYRGQYKERLLSLLRSGLLQPPPGPPRPLPCRAKLPSLACSCPGWAGLGGRAAGGVRGGAGVLPTPGTQPRSRAPCRDAVRAGDVRGRELQGAEEDSTNSFICVLRKMKEVRLVEKVVEETEEGRRGVALAGTALSPSLRCCQAFADRMETLAEQWRDLHARRAQLKAHVVTSGTTVKCGCCWKPPQENERLRTQALKKAKEEKEENSKKESELLRARRELESLRKKHQKLSKKLLKYSPFKKYLEDVVENSQVSLDVAQGGLPWL
ncbi:coiled-coil domain-containing protein 42 [Haemorhous mexicanus]|uniref:coiled-coil domain-containing protein 42 n=1 Tax=Haemorhous mexicanus TaxID=30427 RepID=UPI0028BD310A|nr:coiled-coil domain-containing protein 42 [Haemorhous mexicanus]